MEDKQEAINKAFESDLLYRTIFNQSTDGILIIDTNGAFIEFNEAAHRQLGYSREEFKKLRISDIDPIQNPDEIRASIENIVETGSAEFEVKHRTKEGKIREVHVITQFMVLSGQTLFHTIWRDITEQKAAETRVRESENKFRSIFENVIDGIMIADPETKMHIEANKAICIMLGYTRDELLGLSVDDIHPKKDLPIIRSLFEKQLLGEIIHTPEVPMLRKDGSVFYADINATSVMLGGKQYLAGIFRDITERKRVEDKLKESEKFIRTILDTVDEGFIVVDREYRIQTANRAYCDLLSVPCDEIIGKNCYAVAHKISRPCFLEGEKCAVSQVFADGKTHSILHKHAGLDNNLFSVEIKAFPLKDSSGQVTSAVEVIANVTEKQLLEEERLKTQKLEAVGTLAGGIAHDFNNLLQGVFGFISLAKLKKDDRDKSMAALEEAEKALQMSVNLTNQLLTFSKGGKPVKKPINLLPLIENAAKFALSGSHTDCRVVVDKGLWQVDADEGQISQVIHNIVLNADQAMSEGGWVEITAKNVHIPDIVLPQELGNGRSVEISITDNGVGIPEKYISRIFDPYFTTKGRGSGLGLATSYSIIQNHSGVIDVKSEIGKGTTFSIYLPAITAKRVEVQNNPTTAGTAGYAGRVLVMDDDQVIRDVVGALIGELGHRVEFAEHGTEAVEKYEVAKRAGSPFDVVILDLTIRRGLGGAETLQRLMEIDPGVKAVVSSGYSDDALIAAYQVHGFKAVLKKPYNVDELQDVLNKLLNS